MASLNLIRTLTIRAKTEGVDETAGKMENLASANDNVAVSSVNMSKATLSQEQALLRLLRVIDPTLKAEQNLAKAQKQLDDARNAGLISASQHNVLLKQAQDHFNGAAAAATKHSQAMALVNSEAQGLSGNLGLVGRVLVALGPAGLAAAAAFGAMALAAGAAATAALDLAEKAGKLRDLSDSLGLTTAQIQGLQHAASQVGVSDEQLTTGLEKFASVLGNLRDNNKGAIESFEKLGSGMAQQVASATTFREALDLVFNAMNKLDPAAKALVGGELFGRGGRTGFGRIADEAQKAGGSINDLVKALNPLDVLTRKEIEQFDDLGDAIKRN